MTLDSSRIMTCSALKAEQEARDQLQTSIEHHRVAQDVALRRIPEAQQLQNDV